MQQLITIPLNNCFVAVIFHYSLNDRAPESCWAYPSYRQGTSLVEPPAHCRDLCEQLLVPCTKGNSTLLWRCPPYCFVCTGSCIDSRLLHFSAQSSTDWATTAHCRVLFENKWFPICFWISCIQYFPTVFNLLNTLKVSYNIFIL